MGRYCRMSAPVTFEAIWDRTVAPPGEVTAALPGIGEAGPGQTQVVIGPAPDGADPEARVSLDPLSEKPWVESVVTYRPVEASRTLPNIRSLYHRSSATADGVDEATLQNLVGLETLVTDRIRAEALLALPKLKDLWFDPKTHHVPPGDYTMDLINVPGASDRYRIETDAEAVLARIPTLERLVVSGFHWRNRVDPIAELEGLRWLSLHGWRNLRALGRLVNLERLSLVEFEMANVRAYRGLTKLRKLFLMGRMTSLDGIEALVSLDSLGLRGYVVRDLTPLAALPHLRDLTMTYTDAVTDYAPIGRLEHLRRFELTLGSITDEAELPSIDFLTGLEELEEVVIQNVALADPRLDALIELPRLRRVRLTGKAGPDVDGLRRRRPDLEIDTHLTGEPAGRVHVGPIHYDPPIEGIDRWSLYQDVHDLLGTRTNDAAERLLRRRLKETDPDLLKRLDFDAESGAIGIYAGTEDDIRAVAEALRDLSEST
jgi:hypothetical protein